MSKGTTTLTGMNQTYFANVFGPAQYVPEYDVLSKKYFNHFFTNGTRVGEICTQLGIPGFEHSGPEIAAKELLKLARDKK